MKTLLPIALVGAACSSFNPELGNAPYLCGDIEPRCPTGYTCDDSDPDPTRHVCVAPGGLIPDANNNTGFQCLDDSSFGQNDTTAGAFQTPVAANSQMFSALAAICPELDKDHYAFNIVTQNSNVEVITSWESGMPVNVSILNSAGSSIGNGTPMGEMAFRVCVPNLPVGTYYVSAFAAASVKNNYRVEIKIVPNC
jgi:hypothetical protein